MATPTPIDRERLDALSASFSGTIIEPDDPRVTETRRVHNGLIDKSPALIARVGEPQTHARPALPGVGRAHHAEAAPVGGLDTRSLGELEDVDERPIARHGDLVPDREQVRVGGP
jgi:hypothetical protein